VFRAPKTDAHTLRMVQKRHRWEGRNLRFDEHEIPVGRQSEPDPIRPYENEVKRTLRKEGHRVLPVLEEVRKLHREGKISEACLARCEKKAASYGRAVSKALGPFRFLRGNRLQKAIDALEEVDPQGAKTLAEKIIREQGIQGSPSLIGRLGVGLGLGAGFVGAEEALDQIQARRTQQQMIAAFPELKREDPARVEQAFGVLQTYAPTLTRDPFVAGSAVAKMIQYEGVDPSTVKTLLETQRADNQPVRRMLEAAKGVGMHV